MQKRKLLVEGWRFIAHSYAIVNQWQLLALAGRDDVDLKVRDAPFYASHWRPAKGLFDPELVDILANLPPPEPDFIPEATYRIAYPHNATPAPAGRTLTFGTTELQAVLPDQLQGHGGFAELATRDDWRLVTPSRWSAEGFRKIGLRDEQIVIVPHGVSPAQFRPSPERRRRMRETLGLSGFVFFSAGAMSWNKNIDSLLRAFAVVAYKVKDARLLLKGDDTLFSSNQLLSRTLEALPSDQRRLIQERTIYTGGLVSMEKMADFYRAADCYVSPYRAEGFNMPVLEAAAAGLPVICTKGGATDDFVSDRFARRIDAETKHIERDGATGTYLEASLDHLIALMLGAVEDAAWRAAAAEAGPEHARRSYSWDAVAEQLLAASFPA